MNKTLENKTGTVEVLGKKIDPQKIGSPAFRNMIDKMQDPNYVTRLYNKHSDWREKGQCGCVVGCVGY